MDKTLSAVILAAGFGKRMKSSLPKVLHPLAGLPMIHHTLRAVAVVTPEPPVLIIGHGAEQVRQSVGKLAQYALQEQQLGTAHALQMAEPLLAGKSGLVLVATGDMPLLTANTFQRMLAAHARSSSPVTMLSVILEDSHGFGRVVRSADGSVQAIVEEAQATPEILAIHELNAGVYCFDADWLWPALRQVPLSPKGEYYLTDVVGIAAGQGKRVQALVVEDPLEALGINSREHLAEAEAVMRRRINHRWMEAGVTLVDPETTYIDADVEIGPDTIIYPGTCLRGQTLIERGCQVGPHALITQCHLEENCQVSAAVLEDSHLSAGTRVDAHLHLRDGQMTSPAVHGRIQPRKAPPLD